MDITPSSSTPCTGEMEQANEIVGQLPEILEKIFSDLDIQSLGRAARVNRFWNDLAMPELSKWGPQIMMLPTANVDDFVKIKPLATILFVNSRDWEDGKCKEDLLKYKDSFPNHLVVVPTKLLMMNEEEIFYSDCQSKNGIISLSFPRYRDLKIRTSSDKELFRKWSHCNFQELDQSFLAELLPVDSISKAIFIMFGPPDHNYNGFLLLLEREMELRKQEYIVWGIDFQAPPGAFSDSSFDFRGDCRGLYGMSIAGPSLESSSIIIGCEVKKREFDRKLLDFRSQLCLKRHSIGMLCGPVRNLNEPNLHYSPKELTATVKRIFPSVPFICTFDQFCCYGSKPKTADPNRLLEHLFSYSLMILTYD